MLAGNSFVTEYNVKDTREAFDTALSTDMETTAIAQICSNYVAAHPEAALSHLPRPGDAAAVWLDITLGPRAGWFSPQALALLLEQPW